VKSDCEIILLALGGIDFDLPFLIGSDSIFGAEYFSVPLASLSRKDMASETIAEDDDDDDDDDVV